jgi:hypothetical protein
MTADNLTDGIDMVDSKDIGMTYVTLTAAEVGLKVIITDKLLRQEAWSVFSVVGEQMGRAMSRKLDRDIIALFPTLNSATTLGSLAMTLTMTNTAACVAWSKANKCPNPIAIVHHPNAMYALIKSATAIGASYYAGIMQGYSESLLRNFWKMNIDRVNIFEDGNIDAVAGTSSGYGAIFSKNSMVYVEENSPMVERERDASLRGTEVVITSDYGCFLLDGTYGAPMYYSIAAPATTT